MSEDRARLASLRTQLSHPTAVAVGLMLIAALAASVMHVMVRIASLEISSLQVTFLRSIFAFVVLVPFMIRSGRLKLRTSRPGLHIVRGVLSFLSVAAWYYSLATIPLAEATALSFTTTIFVTAGAALFFGERVGGRRWGAVLVGLLGTLVILRPGFAIVTLGAILAIVSSVLFAAAMLTVKTLSRTDDNLTIIFYAPLLVAIFSLAPAVPVWVWPSPSIWLLGLAMGLLAAISHYVMTEALRIGEASVTMTADYSRLIWTSLIAYVLFQETPDAWTWAGSALILSSTVFITLNETRRKEG
jgi:drug/metabolite transporter (DMT)-like permease